MYNPQMAPFQPENIDRTTSMLMALKKEGRLAQYMQQHKSDPYMMSLASSVNAMFNKAQPQPEAPQSKVADQELAKMAPPPPAQSMPEDVGIGALPAPNMQGMAEGGIVAFGDGGDVQRFAGAGDSLVRSTTGGKDYFLDVPETIRDPSVPYYRQIPNPLASLAGKKFGSREEAAQAYNAAAGVPATPVVAPVAAAPAVVTPGVTPTGGIGNLTQPVTAMPPVAAPAPAPAPTPGAGGPRAPVAATAPLAPAKDFLALQREAEERYGPATDKLRAEREALTAKEKAGEETGLAKLKADQESEMKSMFKGKEERIGKREEELKKSENINAAMSFIDAGLEMIQSTGPGLAGIAKGAGVGFKRYASGIKDIKSAQEKLDDARDRMEELRQNQASMNNREIRAAETGIRAIANKGQRDLLNGLEKATGEKQADVRAAVTSNIAVSEAAKGRAFQAEQGALDRASRAAIASMPGDQQRMLTTLGGAGGLEAGLAKMQEIQADKTGAAYAKLFTETVAEANKAGVTPPTAAQFAASLRQLATAMNPTKVPPPVAATGASRS